MDELVIVEAHYRQHPDCTTLVCFVYDRLANADALENDVSGNESGLSMRVIVAPQPSS